MNMTNLLLGMNNILIVDVF